jgi:hypothetical protein
MLYRFLDFKWNKCYLAFLFMLNKISVSVFIGMSCLSMEQMEDHGVTSDPLMRSLPGAVVCLTVSILKASGLQVCFLCHMLHAKCCF